MNDKGLGESPLRGRLAVARTREVPVRTWPWWSFALLFSISKRFADVSIWKSWGFLGYPLMLGSRHVAAFQIACGERKQNPNWPAARLSLAKAPFLARVS